MVVDPFWFGVGSTILVELVVLVVAALIFGGKKK